MDRYARLAGPYDVLSAEPLYRAGRAAAIPALQLHPGDRVLDIGCGTGLNFPMLLDQVGASGRVVGVDRSAQMLRAARRKSGRWHTDNVILVQADATRLPDDQILAQTEGARGYDAVLFTYSLSLMSPWSEAWRSATALLRDGGRVAVVDMQHPTGAARIASPLARLSCALGGSDIKAHPWRALERETTSVDSWSLRGGHIQVRVGTWSKTGMEIRGAE